MSRMHLLAAPVLAAGLAFVAAPSASAATTTATISKAEYDLIKIGTTTSKMHSIADSGACKLKSRDDSGGVSYRHYECKGNKAYSSASFDFVNGKLEIKSQVFLDGLTSNGKMTKTKYSKIKVGSTISQMHEIAGKGTCVRVAQSHTRTDSMSIYDCEQASTFGAASFFFENGKVTMRNQAGLR
ncbi:hypothetical protein [Streptomyces sp. AP-93]|uniref:hypothetical protein n=1 Tax=Streptomyces sp. AP-93 TaxID=2929048 RepID=UPI001FB00893|nr:hypothetical protein [Streptomyces sp. AP-93]MCJ0872002.1 hypothetical protein [Streptomyces sp. AP-93]